MGSKLDPKQLSQEAASNGEVLTFDTTAAVWKPRPAEVLVKLRNETGVAIAKGKGLAPAGYNVGLGVALVQLGSKDDSAKRPAIAVTTESIPNNTTFFGMKVGCLRGVDTSTFQLSDQLVLGTAGALVRPPITSGEINNIGSVIRVDAANGEIAVNVEGLQEPVDAPGKFTLSASEMVVTGAGIAQVIANGYVAIEHAQAKTAFGHYSFVIQKTPNTPLKVRAKFIVKASGTGSNVRLGAKIKARAVGEDTSTMFDSSVFTAVPITFTTIGELFQGEISVPINVFTASDTVVLQLGRDGENLLGAGTNDDVNQPIQILSWEVEVPS